MNHYDKKILVILGGGCTVAAAFLVGAALMCDHYYRRHVGNVLTGMVKDPSFVVIEYRNGERGITNYLPTKNLSSPDPLVQDYCGEKVTRISLLNLEGTRPMKEGETCKDIAAGNELLGPSRPFSTFPAPFSGAHWNGSS